MCYSCLGSICLGLCLPVFPGNRTLGMPLSILVPGTGTHTGTKAGQEIEDEET